MGLVTGDSLFSYLRGDDKGVDDCQNPPPQSPSGTGISRHVFCPCFRWNAVTASLAISHWDRVEVRKLNSKGQEGICHLPDLGSKNPTQPARFGSLVTKF